MNPEECEPIRKERTWVYPWIGILFGIAVGIFIGHPLSMLAQNFYNSIISSAPIDILGAFSHSFHLHMWPMLLIFGVFGGVVWGFIGFILQRLRESRLRLDAAHRQLLKQTRYLNTYLTVSSMVAQCLDPHELLEAVLNVVMETVSAEGASVLLLDEDQANFQFYSIEGPAKPVLMSATFPADQGIAGSLVQTQRSEVIKDVPQDPRFFGKIDSQYGFSTRNMIAIPLTAGEEKIGVMEVLNKLGGEPFTDEERLLLDSIAEEIAFAIRNARIFEYVVNSYCKQRQGETSCKGCKRPLRSWTPCVKYLEKSL
ncbi:MAG: GAF domain-containing protein [Syntrophobacterales bacterium]|jgi:K+-sensing histidine kinase KdpD|nr:GAF domain-containing protein [Syntrophobacterales bacterium]